MFRLELEKNLKYFHLRKMANVFKSGVQSRLGGNIELIICCCNIHNHLMFVITYTVETFTYRRITRHQHISSTFDCICYRIINVLPPVKFKLHNVYDRLSSLLRNTAP